MRNFYTSFTMIFCLFLATHCSSTKQPAETPPQIEPPQNKQVIEKKDEANNMAIEDNLVKLDEVMEEETQRSPVRRIDKKVKSSAQPLVRTEAYREFSKSGAQMNQLGLATADFDRPQIQHNTEEYDLINENIFLTTRSNPLSTFSIDVDAASYANVRRFINSGQMPYKDAVRIEEMINYFNYDYPEPRKDQPFSITMEISEAPWNTNHQLVHIGLQGKKLDARNLAPSNLVFLIDVSGSMNSPNKLGLLKSSFKILLKNLQSNDRVALAVYAGQAGLVLPSTPVAEKEKILAALDNLRAGGSTAGGAGIKLAYDVAKKNLISDGNNRVILATDGDFNVGTSSTSELTRLIEEKRKDGIYLTICGFGMGNYKDGRMENISNAGNGNYYYIDNILEAKKIFANELQATLFTIAKDVKIQIEFNPEKVGAYRLIGYENRKLANEDFNDDKKDAGELGAGHTVTALYEIIPAGVESEFIKDVDALKYQKLNTTRKSDSGEWMTVKLRYKNPNEDASKLLVETLKGKPVAVAKSSENFRFSAAVAEFGMILRDSEFKQASSYDSVLKLTKAAKGDDTEGYRAEFIRLVEKASLLDGANS